MEFWLSRLDPDTRKADRSHFNRWMKWLTTQPGWENLSPRDVLVRELESEDSYLVLDMLQRYVNTLVLRKSSKRKAYSVVRSFFLHNRCALPQDPSFHVRGDKPSVQGKLSASDPSVLKELLGELQEAGIRSYSELDDTINDRMEWLLEYEHRYPFFVTINWYKPDQVTKRAFNAVGVIRSIVGEILQERHRRRG
jgi:hypothetical protein